MNTLPRLASREEIIRYLVLHEPRIRDWAARYKPHQAAWNRDSLDALAAHIGTDAPLDGWESRAATRFVRFMCGLTRAMMLTPNFDPAVALDSAATIAGLAHEWVSITEATARLEGAGVWCMAALLTSETLPEPAKFEALACSALSALSLHPESLQKQVRAQIVNAYTTRQLSTAPPEIAQWCQELLADNTLSKIVVASAKRLGIAESSQETPTCWPPVPQLADLQASAASLLDDLRVLQTREPDTLSINSHEALASLTVSNIHANGSRLYSIGRDLWRSAWKNKSDTALSLSQRAAALLLSLEHAPDHFANVLHFWMATELPRLIQRFTVQQLLDDAWRLCESRRIRFAELKLQQALIEATAGEYLRLNSEDPAYARDYQAASVVALRECHTEYMKHASVPSEDELFAWNTLAGTQTTASPTPSTLEAIRDVIRQGSPDGVRDFIEQHLDQLKGALQQRLEVQLSREYLLPPEGKIFNTQSSHRRTPHPSFVLAHEALSKGQAAQAANIFKALSERLSGMPRDICRNHQAFAHAKDGNLLLARQVLADIAQHGLPYPSIYWNLACCLPSEEMAARLDALTRAVEFAPTVQIRDAAVYLALLLDDRAKLCTWLPLLPFTEAVILSYYYDYELLDWQGHDRALLRLQTYVEKGEPAPLPAATDRIGFRLLCDMTADLLARDQAPALEFWFRAHAAAFGWRDDYWQARSEFYEKTQRIPEAAEAFVSELRCRFNVITDPRKARIRDSAVQNASRRIAAWLKKCMTEELKARGQEIFNIVRTFADNHPEISILPESNRIRRFYGLGGDDMPLELVLGRISGEATASLHTINDLSTLRASLELLGRALTEAKYDASAAALAALVGAWDRLQTNGAAATKNELASAQSAPAGFRVAILRELPPPLRQSATPLLSAFDRVSNKLARDLGLLSQLVATVDSKSSWGSSGPSAPPGFAARFSLPPASRDVGALRITAATLQLTDGQQFASVDSFEQAPVILTPLQSVLVTFVLPETAASSAIEGVVRVRYEVAGGEFEWSDRVFVELAPPHIADAAGVKYIYGRPIEPDEVASHFFGRDEERRRVIESIANGQERRRYVEGIRRSGKSSLLSSVIREIEDRYHHVVPVKWSALAPMRVATHAGDVLYRIFEAIARSPRLPGIAEALPTRDECRADMLAAYERFENALREKCPDCRVAVLADDFHQVVETAAEAAGSDPSLKKSIISLLDVIAERSTPTAQIVWVFAGSLAFGRFRERLSGPLLWALVRAVPVDFLDAPTVRRVIETPLLSVGLVVPEESVARVMTYTAGYPELVQEMADHMSRAAIQGGRPLITPADADLAASEISRSSDVFFDTWFPMSELTDKQVELIAALVNATAPGGKKLPHVLTKQRETTEAMADAVRDLCARKILVEESDGSVRIRGLLLDLWLRHALPSDVRNGSAGIFVDLANLTAGSGSARIAGLDSLCGDGGIPGRFELRTVFDCIDDLARTITPAPTVKGARWAVNYPAGSAAVLECSAKGYYVEPVPEDYWVKGTDDIVLMQKVWEVQDQYPSVNHYLLVTGDRDYRLLVERLLGNKKVVHVISREDGLSGRYDGLAQRYPDHVKTYRLDALLDTFVSSNARAPSGPHNN